MMTGDTRTAALTIGSKQLAALPESCIVHVLDFINDSPVFEKKEVWPLSQARSHAFRTYFTQCTCWHRATPWARNRYDAISFTTVDNLAHETVEGFWLYDPHVDQPVFMFTSLPPRRLLYQISLLNDSCFTYASPINDVEYKLYIGSHLEPWGESYTYTSTYGKINHAFRKRYTYTAKATFRMTQSEEDYVYVKTTSEVFLIDLDSDSDTSDFNHYP